MHCPKIVAKEKEVMLHEHFHHVRFVHSCSHIHIHHRQICVTNVGLRSLLLQGVLVGHQGSLHCNPIESGREMLDKMLDVMHDSHFGIEDVMPGKVISGHTFGLHRFGVDVECKS